MQPGSKSRRREARRSKAAALAPRPVDKLRPVVRCPTIKHNRRERTGRGFTIAELKVRICFLNGHGLSQWPSNPQDHKTNAQKKQAAGIPRPLAPTIGIAVDHRRQNLSEESIARNVARLKEYHSRLVVLPRRSNAPKKGEVKASDLGADTVRNVAANFPVPVAQSVTEVSVSDMPKPIEGGAHRAYRMAWVNQRHQGAREKRVRDKADAEAAAKK